jgi:uncharacterized lipoprotein YmbA
MKTRAATIFCILAAGCGFLSSKPSHFYSIDTIPPTAPVTDLRGSLVGVEVVLPPGLNRKEIVVRQANHGLEVRGREQWTATLEPLVLHVLAFDLASRLPAGEVVLPGESAPEGAVRTIDVAFEELAPGPAKSVVLDAQWTLHNVPGGSDATHREQIAVEIPTFSSPDIATGMSQAVATLADRIASAVARAR